MRAGEAVRRKGVCGGAGDWQRGGKIWWTETSRSGNKINISYILLFDKARLMVRFRHRKPLG